MTPELKEKIMDVHKRYFPTPIEPEIMREKFALALVGEAGEVAQLFFKKFRDGGGILTMNLRHELADVAIFLELLAHYSHIDLEHAIEEKLKICEQRLSKVGA